MASITERSLYKDDLTAMKFVGRVESNDDPQRLGRARVRVFGKFDDLAVEDLPWAWPGNGTGFGQDGGSSLSIPKNGSIVEVEFDSGDLYMPVYKSAAEPSPNLVDLIRGSYDGAHGVLVDELEKLRIYYTREKGLEINLDDSRVNIASDGSITIEHKGTPSIIELRGGTITITSDSEINLTAGSRIKASAPEVWLDGKETKNGHVPAYSHVLAEPLFASLKALAAIVDAKLYPTPGIATGIIEQAEVLSTSGTCKVSK
jgi:hypothetical protein